MLEEKKYRSAIFMGDYENEDGDVEEEEEEEEDAEEGDETEEKEENIENEPDGAESDSEI